MTTHSRYAAARKWLLFWTLFVGVDAADYPHIGADPLLGLRHTGLRSIRCREGRFREV